MDDFQKIILDEVRLNRSEIKAIRVEINSIKLSVQTKFFRMILLVLAGGGAGGLASKLLKLI